MGDVTIFPLTSSYYSVSCTFPNYDLVWGVAEDSRPNPFAAVASNGGASNGGLGVHGRGEQMPRELHDQSKMRLQSKCGRLPGKGVY